MIVIVQRCPEEKCSKSEEQTIALLGSYELFRYVGGLYRGECSEWSLDGLEKITAMNHQTLLHTHSANGGKSVHEENQIVCELDSRHPL